MAYANIEDRRNYHRQYMKERREWFKSMRCCVECGEQDAYTLNGRRYCYECNEKHKASNEKNYNSELAANRAKQYRDKCAENGICTRCKKRKATEGMKTCSTCRAKDKQRYIKQHTGATPRHLRNDYGLCYKCGKELDGQMNTNGEKSKLCSSCYASNPKPPKVRMLFTPFCDTENAMNTWNELLKKREELLANGTYDYIPIVNIEQRSKY